MVAKGRRKARVILQLAAYALAGLLTTLGIAWCLPFPTEFEAYNQWQPPVGHQASELLPAATLFVDRWSHWKVSSYFRFTEFRPKQGEPYPAPPSNPSALAEELRSLNYREYYASTIEPPESGAFAAWRAEFRGVPFRCVWAWRHSFYPVPAGAEFTHSYLDLTNAFTRAPGPEWLIPVTPVWIGLIADTAIWGLAWYALLYIPLHMKFWMREGRIYYGLCGACGYDLAGVQGRCPECGMEAATEQP